MKPIYNNKYTREWGYTLERLFLPLKESWTENTVCDLKENWRLYLRSGFFRLVSITHFAFYLSFYLLSRLCFNIVGMVFRAVIVGPRLVRQVSPHHRPLERHEFEGVGQDWRLRP